ncbi:NADH oxidase [Lasiosphaeris hirsuta]|uniref:NADH oxidase n=1 Tax=Lasiosphaeris hirsuta TaxID=260670 RepID=A0AA40B0S7_9PEZI|nr:NADH oxidase [Lasiosphaeris hirsuta]
MASRYACREGVDRSTLGEPLRLNFSGRVAKNRLMKAATTEKMASWSPTDKSARGIPGNELVTLYQTWASGGYGIVVTGNILIDHDHIEGKGNMIVPIDAPFSGPLFDGFQKLAAAGRSSGGGTLFLGQLNHPGRQCLQSIQPDPVSASDVQLNMKMFGDGFAQPHPASLDEVSAIAAAFVHASVFLDKAGFDGIQLHAAHGYLLAQFLAETTNLRTDAYGGSLPNRARLITEIADGIRAQTRPDLVLSIKINSVEFEAKGLPTEEAAQLCELLEAHGFDFVELSGGTYEELGLCHRRETTRAREAFFLEFADKIVPRLSRTRTFVTGGLRSAGAMADALGTVDGVGLGRPACSEPNLARDILAGKVDACVKPLLEDNDFGITASLAAAQIGLMGQGLDTVDPSNREVVDALNEGLASWKKTLTGKSGEPVRYGMFLFPFLKSS